ncbi:MAG: hotdog fold thioesterase [Proteobacteria bacterium]|nr:MAG: hotdog fold thioesterase [Pseudomonadota bacterium]
MSQTNIDLLWKTIRDPHAKNMVDHLGISIDYIGTDAIRGSMPVDERTKQPYGLLHGGASVAFAETLASFGSIVHLDAATEMGVGLEINANHLRSATSGRVLGEAKPIHVGRKTQVWVIEIKNEEGKLVCTSRCTIAVVPRR